MTSPNHDDVDAFDLATLVALIKKPRPRRALRNAVNGVQSPALSVAAVIGASTVSAAARENNVDPLSGLVAVDELPLLTDDCLPAGLYTAEDDHDHGASAGHGAHGGASYRDDPFACRFENPFGGHHSHGGHGENGGAQYTDAAHGGGLGHGVAEHGAHHAHAHDGHHVGNHEHHDGAAHANHGLHAAQGRDGHGAGHDSHHADGSAHDHQTHAGDEASHGASHGGHAHHAAHHAHGTAQQGGAAHHDHSHDHDIGATEHAAYKAAEDEIDPGQLIDVFSNHDHEATRTEALQRADIGSADKSLAPAGHSHHHASLEDLSLPPVEDLSAPPAPII